MNDFQVWSPSRGQAEGDARLITAYHHSEAAEKWAYFDDWNSAEFAIVKGEPATLFVRLNVEGAKPLRYAVTGESQRVYHAKHIVGAPT